MDNKRARVGLLDVLVIIFVVLKLVGVIEWSWIWVLSPIWIAVIFAVIVGVLEALNDKEIK